MGWRSLLFHDNAWSGRVRLTYLTAYYRQSQACLNHAMLRPYRALQNSFSWLGRCPLNCRTGALPELLMCTEALERASPNDLMSIRFVA